MVVMPRNSVAAFRRVSLFFVAAASCLLAILAAPAASAQVSPIGDTYASTSAPAENFGGNPALAVSANETSYIRFDFSSIPTGSTVNRATLVLFVDAVTGSGEMDVYKISTSWNESTLTQMNAPPRGAIQTTGSPISIAGFARDFRLDPLPAWCTAGSTALPPTMHSSSL